MTHILAIDLGTTFFKFALFDRTGRLCDVVRVAPPVWSPEPGWLELDAAAFTGVLAEGIAQLRRADSNGMARLDAVTFATQTNSFVLLDDQDCPLTPIILWPDRRAEQFEEECRHLAAIPGFTATTGIPSLSHQFMVAKLLWFQQHHPEVWRRTRRLCLISDYLGWLLTGRLVTEVGAAALTALVDVPRAQWWPTMLDRIGLDAAVLPEIVRAGTDLGTVLPAAAERFGLPASCHFVVGCLDQYAGAVGVGNVGPGGVSETTGTVLAAVRCSDQFAAVASPGVFQGPAFRPGLYYQMVFGDISANYLEWYRNTLADRPEAADLVALIDAVPLGADGLRLNANCLPAAPQDVFVGQAAPTRGQAVRCILEAVAVALRDHVRALCGGEFPAEIRSAGGAARSDRWLQIKADMLGIPVAATRCAEPTSLGAALLAEASLRGVDAVRLVGEWVRLGEPNLPDPERHRRYQELYPCSIS